MAWIYWIIAACQRRIAWINAAVDPRQAWMNVGDYGTMPGIDCAIVPFSAQANATPVLLPSENMLYR